MSKVKYLYVRDEKKFPVGCVAYQINSDLTVNVGFTVFNPKDEFNREEARVYAAYRMFAKPLVLGYEKGQTLPSTADAFNALGIALMQVAALETMPWGFDTNGPGHRVPARFIDACLNMVERFVSSAKRNQEKAVKKSAKKSAKIKKATASVKKVTKKLKKAVKAVTKKAAKKAAKKTTKRAVKKAA